jgi:enamine deaminase RidA (YjgF/YER057c/UK114 family)
MLSPRAKPLLIFSSTIALAACSNAPARLDAVDASDAPMPSGGYAQAIAVSDATRLLYVSGQIPVDTEGRTPTGFEAQCRLVWANLLAQLRSAGMQEADLVKVTTYLSDRRYAAENSRIRRELLGSHRPALTVIISGIYDPEWLLEIEAVAAQ